jgi:ribosomal protein L37AE/L43A
MESKVELPVTRPDDMFKLLSKNVKTKKALQLSETKSEIKQETKSVSFKDLEPIPEKKGSRIIRETMKEEVREEKSLKCCRCKNEMKYDDVVLSCKNCYDELEDNHYEEFLHVLSAVNAEIEKLKDENEHLLEKLRILI